MKMKPAQIAEHQFGIAEPEPQPAMNLSIEPKEPESEGEDYWSGVGFITLFVEQNTPEVFEFSILDYSGCVHGMTEGIGIDYYLTDVWGLQDQLREGVTYTIENVTVEWFDGGYWDDDDDVEYCHGKITPSFCLLTYLKQKASNFWHRFRLDTLLHRT